MLDVEDVDPEASVSTTWSVDPSGTMRHKASGMKASDHGIVVDGVDHSLGPQDIEVDRDSHLGAGAGGVVQRGMIVSWTPPVPVAVKIVKLDDRAKREQFVNEVRGLTSAEGCPYLVQWYGGFASKRSGAVHVALELMDRGSLRDLTTKYLGGAGVPLEHLKLITFQIMQGLLHLHNQRMLHRDIKPENILMNSRGQVKLTDFGIAKDLEATLAMAGTFVGTVTCISPERAMGEDYSFPSDIWSVGMVIYELATGRYPFTDVSSFPVLFDQLCEQPEPRLDPSYFDPSLCDFVAKCLTRDVALRPDTYALASHPFVMDGRESEDALASWFATLR